MEKGREYLVRQLITRGDMHKLRCEDDVFVSETEKHILMAVFDGCSSGNDSHFASTAYKLALSKLQETLLSPLFEEMEGMVGDCSRLVTIVQNTHKMVGNLIIEFGLNPLANDMLSTAIFALFNKERSMVNIIFCGDGVAYIDGKEHCVHNEDSSVYYLSTVSQQGFRDYIDNHCLRLCNIPVENGLSISTDGIDSFIDKYRKNYGEEARTLFFESDRFTGNKFMLTRLYNIFTKEEDKNCIRNQDDFSMVRLIIKKEEPEKLKVKKEELVLEEDDG